MPFDRLRFRRTGKTTFIVTLDAVLPVNSLPQIASVGLLASGSHGPGGVSLEGICECFIGCDIHICGRRTRVPQGAIYRCPSHQLLAPHSNSSHSESSLFCPPSHTCI